MPFALARLIEILVEFEDLSLQTFTNFMVVTMHLFHLTCLAIAIVRQFVFLFVSLSLFSVVRY